ncbi:DUF1194 domain-containing protein [Ensifer sp. IC4062]|nr:DUF1194 domain-containing protein [Ensifer sp. IC4062]
MGANSFLRLAGTLAACVLWGPQARATDVDAAVVFAVDISSSVDPKSAELQRSGHVAALTSPEVIEAIARNRFGCISITYFEWSSPGQLRTVLPWTNICGRTDAETAALVIQERGNDGFRPKGRGGTSISLAIDAASLLLDQFRGQAAKKVIDISGNGENNDGLPVQQSRLTAIAKGYTINAIAVPPEDENPRHQLATYFADNVIGGPGAFAMTTTGARDYTAALRRKLVTEISQNADCLGSHAAACRPTLSAVPQPRAGGRGGSTAAIGTSRSVWMIARASSKGELP